MNGFLQLGFLPRSYDAGLLVLRLWYGLSLFLNHGLAKITHASQMANHFPDPLHIGSHASLAFGLLCDAVCSILIIVGFATRLAALGVMIILGVAFFLVHHAKFSGPGNGELPYLYIGAALVLLIAGPGRYSADRSA